MNHSLVKRLRFLAELGPANSVQLNDGNDAISLEQLIERAIQLAKRIRIAQVKVVALRAGNSTEWVVTDLACQFSGAVFVPLPDYFSAQQVRYCLNTMGVELLLGDVPTDDWCEPEARSLDWSDVTRYRVRRLTTDSKVPALPDGTGKVTFTSGSTGNPKGVCLSTEHQWRVAESLSDAIGVRAPRHLCLLPLATLLENIGGIYTPLLCGGEILLPDAGTRGFLGSSSLDTDVLLQCLTQARPNTLILIPQLLKLLVTASETGWQAPDSLKFVAVGGGKVAPELLIRARELGMPVYEGYGLSECGSVVALNTPVSDSPGTVGRVLPHCHVAIRHREVTVEGAGFLGYVNEPDSWYPETVFTGDLGSLRNGHLLVNGRSKNLLISSYGRNINPEWVESELLAGPLINQCVVLGDQKPWLVAVIGANPASSDAAIDQWFRQVNAKLPDYARVKSWSRLEAGAWQRLLTANGRPRRDLLITQYASLINSMYQDDQRLQL